MFFNFEIEDYVLHYKYGVGQIVSLDQMNINNTLQDFIKIKYNDCEIFIPALRTGSLDNAGKSARLKKEKQIKDSILKDSKELIEAFFAKQNIKFDELKMPAGYSKFKSNCNFTLTKDQESAINDCLNDLQSTKVTDRLICADVGFGKTEVAMHAMYLTIMNKLKVLVIVPTKILANQHFEVFSKRFEYLNKKIAILDDEQSKKDWLDGKIDCAISTISHKYIDNILHKKIGLIVLDEEQHFGVKMKEKIRAKYRFIQLSATPIPRTLSLALCDFKDISVILTAPNAKKTIDVEVIELDKEYIMQEITKAIQNNGKAFLIVPKIRLIQEIELLVKDFKYTVLHGKLSYQEMQENLNDFEKNDSQIMIATSIVESGINIFNANLMVIFYSNMFGISQLYQLKGRLGRNENYSKLIMIAPKGIKELAKQRLNAIEEYSELGDNFNLSVKDMDTRGSGGMVSLKQSGKSHELGAQFYFETIKEALHGKQDNDEKSDIINTKLKDITISDNFITDVNLKLSFYQKFNKIKTEKDLQKMVNEFSDSGSEIDHLFQLKMEELRTGIS